MKIVIGIVSVLVGLCVVGLLLPTEFAVAKSVTINAEPAEVHAWVGDLKKWDEWTPWAAEDPTMKTTIGDLSTGIGAHQSWSGKDGDGELTFTKCDPATGIAYDMKFVAGDQESPATSAMTYEKAEGGTTVTWTMEGDTSTMMPPVIAGYINAFMMKGSIDDMFNTGLETLKNKVEGK